MIFLNLCLCVQGLANLFMEDLMPYLEKELKSKRTDNRKVWFAVRLFHICIFYFTFPLQHCVSPEPALDSETGVCDVDVHIKCPTPKQLQARNVPLVFPKGWNKPETYQKHITFHSCDYRLTKSIAEKQRMINMALMKLMKFELMVLTAAILFYRLLKLLISCCKSICLKG